VADQYSQLATVDADGETQEAEQFAIFGRALVIREGAFGQDHQDVAESLEDLASLYEVNDQFDKAEPLHERVLAIRQKCLPQEHPEVVRGISTLADFYQRFERPSKAEPVFRRLLTLREKILGPKHLDVAECLQKLAEVCHSQHKLAEALPLYERALAIREAFDFVPPPRSGNLGDNLVCIANLYLEQGNINKAEKVLQRAVTMQQLEFQPGDPRAAEALKALADLYHADERMEEAQPLYEQLIDSWKNSRAMAHLPSEVPATLTKLADIYLGQGRGAEAEFLYRHALGIWEKGLSSEPYYFGNNIAETTVSLFEEQGRDAEADPFAEHALVHLRNATWPEHEQLVMALEKYAALLRDTGRPSDAEMLELEAKAIQGGSTEPKSNVIPVEALKQIDQAEMLDLEVKAIQSGSTESQSNAVSIEALKLIDQMVAELDLSEDSREELLGYKQDINNGEFDEADWRYLQSFNARLSKRR
jgi:tetratricopeptide (TPR) repeat protein